MNNEHISGVSGFSGYSGISGFSGVSGVSGKCKAREALDKRLQDKKEKMKEVDKLLEPFKIFQKRLGEDFCCVKIPVCKETRHKGWFGRYHSTYEKTFSIVSSSLISTGEYAYFQIITNDEPLVSFLIGYDKGEKKHYLKYCNSRYHTSVSIIFFEDEYDKFYSYILDKVEYIIENFRMLGEK